MPVPKNTARRVLRTSLIVTGTLIALIFAAMYLYGSSLYRLRDMGMSPSPATVNARRQQDLKLYLITGGGVLLGVSLVVWGRMLWPRRHHEPFGKIAAKVETPEDNTTLYAQVEAARTLRDNLDKHTEAITAFESALQRAAIEVGTESREFASIRAELAWTRIWAGDLARAAQEIDESIRWAESQTPKNEVSLAVWSAWRARIHQDRGMLKEAEADIAYSIAWCEAHSPRNEHALAMNYASRARIRQDRGDLAGAEADIDKSIAWCEAQSPRNEVGLAICYAARASIRDDRGDLPGAEADITSSIALGEDQSARDERSLAMNYASRARIRRDRKQYPRALADIERSLAWIKAQQPIDERAKAYCSGDRATILAEMNRLPEAITDIAACIAWHRQHQPDNKHSMAHRLRDQARILALAGDWPAAAAAIAESLPLREAVYGTDHDWTKKARVWQAAIAKQQVPPRWLDTTL